MILLEMLAGIAVYAVLVFLLIVFTAWMDGS